MGMFVHTVPEGTEASGHMLNYHPNKFRQISCTPIIEKFTPEDPRPAPTVDPTAAAAADEEDEDSEPDPLPPEPADDDQAEGWRIFESRMAKRQARRKEKREARETYIARQKALELQQRREAKKEALQAQMQRDVAEGRPPGMGPMMPRPKDAPPPQALPKTTPEPPPTVTQPQHISTEDARMAEKVKQECGVDKRIPIDPRYWEMLKSQGPPPMPDPDATQEKMLEFLNGKTTQYKMLCLEDLRILKAAAAKQHNDRWDWIDYSRNEAMLMRHMNSI